MSGICIPSRKHKQMIAKTVETVVRCEWQEKHTEDQWRNNWKGNYRAKKWNAESGVLPGRRMYGNMFLFKLAANNVSGKL
jgi:hypothetical protein